MHRTLIFLTLLICSTLSMSAHDIHVSVSDIHCGDNKIEITIKTFLDDLQVAMDLEPGEEIPVAYSSAEEMISNYIQKEIQFSIDDKSIELIPTTIDASNDAVWITIIIENIAIEKGQKLSWSSTFLNDIYDDQTNIVNIKKDGRSEVFSLSRKKTSLTHKL